MRQKVGEVVLELITGDIADQEDVEVVVNAANAALVPGGGVAGAIHRAAGPELAESCRDLAPIQPGQAVITEAFGLPNDYVVHCLGPVYGRDEPEEELLASCYRSALLLADEHEVSSIAFPAISAGAFHYPLREAAEVALQAVADSVHDLKSIRLVRFVLFREHDREVFEQALHRVFSA